MNETEDNSRMRMPWPVKVVWWWYLTLVCASCIPLVFCLVKCDPFGRSELFQLLAGTASLAAYFSGLALAVRRGRRGWATVPYGVGAGLLMIMIGWEAVLRYGLSLKNGLALFVAAAATIFPIALLHLPSSKGWFQRWPRQKRLGVGCGWLFGVFVVGFLVASIDFWPSEAGVIAARSSAMARRGHNLFCVLAENELARQSGGFWVDPTTCSNSVEFIEKLLAQHRPDEKAEWIQQEAHQWSVAVNVPESATNFPVFVSANLDPSQFPRVWNGVTDADRKFELAQLPGADELRIGKKAVIIVRKSGAASVYKAKYCQIRFILNGSYELGEDAYFLTPAGKVRLKGMDETR